jgi:hypothetical protein
MQRDGWTDKNSEANLGIFASFNCKHLKNKKYIVVSALLPLWSSGQSFWLSTSHCLFLPI